MKKFIAIIMTVIIAVLSTPLAMAAEVKKGDVNADNKVNSFDAMQILGYTTDKKVTLKNKTAADYNGDGKIDAKDSLGILVYCAKKSNITTTTAKPTTTTAPNYKLASSVNTISNLTPPSTLKLDNNNVPLSYKKKITGTASAYSGGGLTATGYSCRPGYIAVNPRQIPYHTKMWIVSNDGKYIYGYASAEDTGGFVNWTGSRATLCDLYFTSNSACNTFGRRGVTIYIL